MAKGSNTFGGTVKLDGESEYRKALSNITAQLGVVSSEMNKVTAEFGKNDKSIQGLTSKEDVLNKKLEAQEDKVKTLRGALEQAKEQYGETDTKTLKWQKSLNNAEADVIKTKKEIDDLGKEVEDSGKKAEKSSEGFTVFKGILSNLGADAIKSAINGLKSLGSAMIDAGKQAIQNYADYEQLVGGVESMFGGMEKGSEQINKVMGLSKNAWKDLTMSQNDYITSFNSTYPLMKNDIEDQNEAIEKTNRIMTLNSDLANTFGYSMDSASNAVNWALKGTFSYLDNLNIGIKGTKEGFLEAAQSVGYTVKSVDELSSSDILDILEKCADKYGVLGKTSDEAKNTIQGTTKMMRSAWSNLLTGIADDEADFDSLVSNLVDSVTAFGEQIIPRVKTVLEGIGKLIKELVPKLAQELPSLLQSILPSLISGVVDLIKALSDALPSLIPVLMDGIVQAFTGIVDILPDILQALIQATVLIVQSLAEQLPTIIPKLIDAILEMIPMLIDNLPLFIKAGWQLIIGLAQGLLNSIPTLLSYLPKIGKSMLDYFKQLPSMFVEIGGNIIKGLWNGIKNVKDWLFDKIKGFKDAVLNKFKSFFGIKSPSTLFRDEVGTYLAQGIGVGFTDEMKSVAEDMVHALPTDFDVTPNITTGFSSKKQYSDNNVVSDENKGGNFTAIINNNSKYTSPSDNVRKLRQEYELYRLKYGKVGA